MNTEKLKKTAKQMSTFVFVFLALMVLFVAVATVSFSLPTEPVRNRVLDSVPLFESEREYPKYFFGTWQACGDNYSELLALEFAVYDSDAPALSRAMAPERLVGKGDMIQIFRWNLGLPNENDDNEPREPRVMARYWHGSTVLLRVLMQFMGYRHIRYLCFFVFVIFLFSLLTSIRRRLGLLEAYLFLFAMLAVNFFVIPATTTMVMPWLITFAACFVLLKKKTYGLFDCSMLFFVTGCCINFFEYMLTAILALGIPLALLFAILAKEQPGRRPWQDAKLLLLPSIAYFMGFGLSWLFKWSISSVITGTNVFSEAFNALLMRADTNAIGNRLFTPLTNYRYLMEQPVVLMLLVVSLVFLCLGFLLRKNKSLRYWNSRYALLVVSLYPVVWYLFTAQHALQHVRHTYRYAVISLLAALLFLASFLDMSALKILATEKQAQIKTKLQVRKE